MRVVWGYASFLIVVPLLSIAVGVYYITLVQVCRDKRLAEVQQCLNVMQMRRCLARLAGRRLLCLPPSHSTTAGRC